MTAPIKAIETRYAGCRFRSRTEARWAVFFDTMKVKWEYEREGFELPTGRYLPDFWIPEWQVWFEIKGEVPEVREWILAEELAKGSGHPVLFGIGTPGQPEGVGYDFCHHMKLSERRDEPGSVYLVDDAYCWEPMRLAPDRSNARIDDHVPNRSSRIETAIAAARSARFEFGDAA